MEDNKVNKPLNGQMEREYKNLAKNSFFSFIHSYSGFFLSIITSFIMARIISQITWGFLIISLSFITIFALTLSFLPPSLGLSFNYYIPRYRALKQNNKLKSLIKKSLVIRLVCVIVVFFISLFIIFVLVELLSFNIGGYDFLLYILSPLIIIQGLDKIFGDILRGFNLFKVAYYLLILRYCINIIGLIFLFLNIHIVNLNNIAFVLLLSELIPFIIDSFIVYRLQFKIKKSEEKSLTYKEVLKRLIKYGSNLSVKMYLDNFNREFKTILVGAFQPFGVITGYNIGVHYSDVSFEAIRSFNRPLTISFSSLSAKDKTNKIEAIYRNLFHYAQFFILLITGVLFFIIDIYLNLIYSEYSESFSLYSIIMKFLILAMIFNIKPAFFYSLLRASDKVKYIVPISAFTFLINLTIFSLGLLYFGIIGGVIGVIIGNVISFIVFSFLVSKLFNIRLDIVKTISLYSIFFFALGFSLFLERIFLAELNYFIIKNLNLLVFRSFQILSLASFLLLFLSFTILVGVFSTADINNLEAIFDRDNFTDKTIRRSLKILKKFIKD